MAQVTRSRGQVGAEPRSVTIGDAAAGGLETGHGHLDVPRAQHKGGLGVGVHECGGMNEGQCHRLAHCPLMESPHHQATLSLSTQVPLWDVRQGPKEHPGTAGTLLTHLHTRGHHPQASLGAPTSLFNSNWPRGPQGNEEASGEPSASRLALGGGPDPIPAHKQPDRQLGTLPTAIRGHQGLTHSAGSPALYLPNE